MVLFSAAKNDILARITESSSNLFDNENDDFCNENWNFDDYGDENDQRTDKYHGFLVKIYHFWALILGKKRTKIINFFMDVVP